MIPHFLVPDEADEEDPFAQAPQGRRKNKRKARRRIQGPVQQSVLDEDWTAAYEFSPCFGKIWHDTFDPEASWPQGVKVYNQKLYQGEMLCIPLGLELRVVGDHHLTTGHLGVQRMVRDMAHRYIFDANVDSLIIAKKIKEQCNICQACEHPNWQAKGPIEMTSLVPRAMASICIDIFSPPETTWRGKVYNALIVWVDRLSGWIGAIPTQKKGLTAQKCAHLMLERGWDIFGIPSIVTSDQGPQFSGKWWRTMCARLGIRQAFSHAHRPQGNGRAEVAGKNLFAILRKMHATQSINWVEALPQAIRHYKNAINDSGLSPYQILFGRDRLEAGVPYQPAQECETAQGFFIRMAQIDAEVTKNFNELHKKQQDRINAKRKPRTPFKVGDKVWALRPPPLQGHKLESWWLGPAVVLARVGNSSYRIQHKESETWDVHMDFLKPWVEDQVMGTSVPLFFHQGTTHPTGL